MCKREREIREDEQLNIYLTDRKKKRFRHALASPAANGGTSTEGKKIERKSSYYF